MNNFKNFNNKLWHLWRYWWVIWGVPKLQLQQSTLMRAKSLEGNMHPHWWALWKLLLKMTLGQLLFIFDEIIDFWYWSFPYLEEQQHYSLTSWLQLKVLNCSHKVCQTILGFLDTFPTPHYRKKSYKMILELFLTPTSRRVLHIGWIFTQNTKWKLSLIVAKSLTSSPPHSATKWSDFSKSKAEIGSMQKHWTNN